MGTNKKRYRIVFTKECKKEMDRIFYYMSSVLQAENSVKKLMLRIENKLKSLSILPKVYSIIKKHDWLELEYRRMVINNYVILYTIVEEENTIYISHMYSIGSNYLDKI